MFISNKNGFDVEVTFSSNMCLIDELSKTFLIRSDHYDCIDFDDFVNYALNKFLDDEKKKINIEKGATTTAP